MVILPGVDHPAITDGCAATILRVVEDLPGVAAPAQDAILAWYAEHGRPLAFRRTTDPYAILVSEAMAQQTQASRAAAYWERFMIRFPSVAALASATPADVLREWHGLGYDRRALALWRAARVIVADHGGRVPDSIEALQALPGVGPYTARAVAALAFGQAAGAVDVNVSRVLGRIVAGPAPIPASDLQAVADAAVPRERPGVWTHALMDVGATLCRPRNPRCDACPARPWCRYAAALADAAAPVRPAGRLRPATERTAPPFPATTRWLRGRILDRLRAVPGDAWVEVQSPIGSHGPQEVRAAVASMSSDGLIEIQDASSPAIHARLATS